MLERRDDVVALEREAGPAALGQEQPHALVVFSRIDGDRRAVGARLFGLRDRVVKVLAAFGSQLMKCEWGYSEPFDRRFAAGIEAVDRRYIPASLSIARACSTVSVGCAFRTSSRRLRSRGLSPFRASRSCTCFSATPAGIGPSSLFVARLVRIEIARTHWYIGYFGRLGNPRQCRFGPRLGPLPALLPLLGLELGQPLGAIAFADGRELFRVLLRRIEPVRELLLQLHRQNVDLDLLGAHAACLSGTSSNFGAEPFQASQPFHAVPATTTSRSLCTLMP